MMAAGGGLPHRSGKLVIPEIDGLRGIAILGVIWGHAFSTTMSKMNLYLFKLWLTPYLIGGWHGVNLFFILSAFVLFLPYATGARDMGAPGSVWRFYKHRALRLLPAYYLIVIAQMSFTGHSPLASGYLARETVAVLTFTFPFMSDMWSPSAVNGVVWSLGSEVLFSAAFPLLCWLCLRFGSARILAVSLPIGFGFRLFGFHIEPPEPVNWMEAMMVGRIDEFLWGFLLAEMYARGRIVRRPYLLWVLGMAVLLPTLREYSHISKLNPYFHLQLTSFVVLIDIAAVLLVASALAGRSWWSSFLTMRWLRVAGMACYSLYLWHYQLMLTFDIASDPWHPQHLAAYVLFLCILAGITYRFVEFRGVGDWRSLFLIEGSRRPVAAMAASPHG